MLWTVLWATIRKARNHCQDIDNCRDVDNCRDEDHCQTGNRYPIESTVREMSMQIDDQDQWSALKYN